MNTSLFLLISATFVAVVKPHRIPFFLIEKPCETRDCFVSLDNNNQCSDFYTHVCSKWTRANKKPQSEPFWNQYSLTRDVIYSRIKKLLAERDDVQNSKKFYEICVKSENEDFTEGFLVLIAKLGGWTSENENPSKYNYLEHIVEVTKTLNANPILKFHVDTDTKNRSRSALYIESGSFVFPEIFLLDAENHSNQLKTYRNWIEQTLTAIFTNGTLDGFKITTAEIVEFEIELARLASEKYEKETVEIGKLRTIFGAKFDNVIRFIFENTNVDYQKVSQVIARPGFLFKLDEFLSRIQPRIISNYIIWTAIKDMARTVSSKLREINHQVDREILGVEKDVPFEDECLQNTLEYFSAELAVPYTKVHLDPMTIPKVRSMTKNVKMEFLQMLENADWLSGITKFLLIKRASGVKFDVGYSKNVMDASFFKIHFPATYFLSTLKMKSFKSKLHFNTLQTAKIRWPGHIFEVNAYYNVLQNAIILPLGILHPPFFDAKNDHASNYGALGALIGHEMSHSLDFLTGIKHFWPSDDLHRFVERAACFENQYNSFGIDGIFTVNENIADNVGMRASFNALQTVTEVSFSEKRDFFIKFGEMWCEVYGNENIIMHEEHAPVRYRVIGAVSNFQEFRDAFECANIVSNKCSLWA